MNELLQRRATLLERISGREPLDVVVVGGGINGVGVLLDAVQRGLSAVLIERDDLAVGTSSRSSKLIHGGLRYLEHFDFGLVREALSERAVLTRIAPHLVSLRRFLVPVVGGRWQLPYIGAGLALYDLLGGRRGGGFQAFGRAGLLEQSGGIGLDPEVVVGGFEYTDAVCDDARMVVAVASTARRMGGGLVTHAEIADIAYTGTGWELTVSDRIAGGSVTVRARAVVDATGAFESENPEFASEGSVIASRGSHLVLAGDRLPGNRGITIRVPDRVVFVIPWGRSWLVGTTDVSHVAGVDRPPTTAEEVDYLLGTVNRVLATDLARSDIVATFAGIRPLAGDEAAATHDVSREHRIEDDGRGMITVRGGKYTTYRLIAAEAVDLAVANLGIRIPSTTDARMLAGGATPSRLEATVADLSSSGLSDLEARWLVGRHGVNAPEVLEAGRAAGLEGALHPDMPYLAAEAWWAIHREFALTIDDVLARRTRLAIETRDHGAAAAPLVARLLSEVHGWTKGDAARAITSYLASATREYGIPAAP